MQVLSYPLFTTDKNYQQLLLLISSYGKDADNLAPIATPSILLS